MPDLLAGSSSYAEDEVIEKGWQAGIEAGEKSMTAQCEERPLRLSPICRHGSVQGRQRVRHARHAGGAPYQKRGEQYLLIKSPPASGKSRALMFIALDKLEKPGAEAGDHRGAGALQSGRRSRTRRCRNTRFWSDWSVAPTVEPPATPPGADDPRVARARWHRSRLSCASDDRVFCLHPCHHSASPWTTWASKPSTTGLSRLTSSTMSAPNPKTAWVPHLCGTS